MFGQTQHSIPEAERRRIRETMDNGTLVIEPENLGEGLYHFNSCFLEKDRQGRRWGCHRIDFASSLVLFKAEHPELRLVSVSDAECMPKIDARTLGRLVIFEPISKK